MDFSSMTASQKKMLGAGGAAALFAISLFLPFVGSGNFSRSGMDTLPSGWLWLIMGAAAAVILIMEALDKEIPIPLPPFTLAFYLISVPFILLLSLLLEGTSNTQFGFFLALVSSAAATVLAIMIAREEEM